jgi:hypothetical protein
VCGGDEEDDSERLGDEHGDVGVYATGLTSSKEICPRFYICSLISCEHEKSGLPVGSFFFPLSLDTQPQYITLPVFVLPAIPLTVFSSRWESNLQLPVPLSEGPRWRWPVLTARPRSCLELRKPFVSASLRSILAWTWTQTPSCSSACSALRCVVVPSRSPYGPPARSQYFWDTGFP